MTLVPKDDAQDKHKKLSWLVCEPIQPVELSGSEGKRSGGDVGVR